MTPSPLLSCPAYEQQHQNNQLCGYCDCGGFFGCDDPEPVAQKPDAKGLQAASRRHETVVNEKDVERYAEAMPEWDKNPPGTLIECGVCDKSHLFDHPHIANIEGDIPIDDGPDEPVVPTAMETTAPTELPDWLRDKPVQVQTTREDCGLIKRSNHKCKGAAAVEKPCTYCARAGEPCVRHGGERSSVRTAKRFQDRQEAAEPLPEVKVDERVAEALPAPVSVAEPEMTGTCRNGHPRTPENIYNRSDGRIECKECKRQYKNNFRPALPAEADRELAAIGTILAAVDGLAPDEVKRAFAYVADRKGIKQETES
jgi:hypothetical protein